MHHQPNLPFPEPAERRGVCRQCGGPTKFIGKIKGGSIRRCDHCGARQGELSHCKSTQTQVDSHKPHKCETAEVGASAVSVISTPFVAVGSVGLAHLTEEGGSHERD